MCQSSPYRGYIRGQKLIAKLWRRRRRAHGIGIAGIKLAHALEDVVIAAPVLEQEFMDH